MQAVRGSLRTHPSRLRAARGRRARPAGFTLIELMIVVAVIGVLALIAYPAYQNQVRKGHRSDAVVAINRVLQAQERWRANNATYADQAKLTTAPPTGLGLSATSPAGYYTLLISAPDDRSYTLSATAVSTRSQSGDTGCTTLTMTVDRGDATPTPTACWSK